MKYKHKTRLLTTWMTWPYLHKSGEQISPNFNWTYYTRNTWNQFLVLAWQVSNCDNVTSREQIQFEVVIEQNTKIRLFVKLYAKVDYFVAILKNGSITESVV